MRAYGFTDIGAPEKHALLDVPVPRPSPDELLVRVLAAGVTPGDWPDTRRLSAATDLRITTASPR
jgi:NADPH:quinone reductase-like Zn-dependent oxidoreductase